MSASVNLSGPPLHTSWVSVTHARIGNPPGSGTIDKKDRCSQSVSLLEGRVSTVNAFCARHSGFWLSTCGGDLPLYVMLDRPHGRWHLESMLDTRG